MSLPNFKELMIQSQSGDQNTYEKLLQLIYPKVQAFLIKKAGPLALTDDVCQDCLIAIHKAKHTYDPQKEFEPWMYAIVRNKLIDHFRKNQRLSKKEVTTDKIDVTDRQLHSYSDVKEDNIRQTLHDCIAWLPSEMREAVEMIKINGHSTKEYAELKGTTEVAVRARISRAYKLLRTKLEKELGW